MWIWLSEAPNDPLSPGLSPVRQRQRPQAHLPQASVRLSLDGMMTLSPRCWQRSICREQNFAGTNCAPFHWNRDFYRSIWLEMSWQCTKEPKCSCRMSRRGWVAEALRSWWKARGQPTYIRWGQHSDEQKKKKTSFKKRKRKERMFSYWNFTLNSETQIVNKACTISWGSLVLVKLEEKQESNTDCFSSVRFFFSGKHPWWHVSLTHKVTDRVLCAKTCRV